MGGNSFPETQRLSESEYTRICQLITKYLTKIGVEHRIPVEVLDKAEICAVRGMTEPYGDVDVIVAQQNEVSILPLFLEILCFLLLLTNT